MFDSHVDSIPQQEDPNLLDNIYSYAERLRKNDGHVLEIQNMIAARNYGAVVPAEYTKWIRNERDHNVVTLVATLNEYTRSLIAETLAMLEQAYINSQNSAQPGVPLTAETMQHFLQSGIASVTPNLYNAEYLARQGDPDFQYAAFQHNPEIKGMVLQIVLAHVKRGFGSAMVSDSALVDILLSVSTHDSIVSEEAITISAGRYIEMLEAAGMIDTFAIKELTDHLEAVFTDIAEVMRRTMGPTGSDDLYNNILGLQAFILSFVGEKINERLGTAAFVEIEQEEDNDNLQES